MSGVSQTVIRDSRTTARQPTGNAMNSTAFQGANVAFNAFSTQRGAQSSTQTSKETSRTPRKIDVPRSTQQDDEPEPVSELPEAGIVMDRIKAFSGNSSARQTPKGKGNVKVSNSETPQMQAAALAAIRSTSRTPQATPSPQTVSPIKKAMTGNPSSMKKAISPAPKSDFLTVQNSRPVYAPSPIRKTPVVAQSLVNIIDNEETTSGRLQPKQPPRLPSNNNKKETFKDPPKVTSVIRPASERNSNISVPKQPERSESSQNKPKPVPPISKSKSTTPAVTDKSPLPALPNRTVSRLRVGASTDISQNSGNNATSRVRETSQSDTATINSSYTQSTSDEAASLSSFQNSPSRQNTGNVDGTSGMTRETLADAIIASSLASSRAPSPYNPPPLPPPRRTRSYSLLHPGDILKKDIRTTPSPPKGLRQTLRDPPKPDADESKNSDRRRLIKHHPHKHHEGDRRRWRQEVTEVARKRYEGLWAANKGLWVPAESVIYQIFPDIPRTLVVSDLVVHLVVRDVWLRSRLPDHTLEQIWNLVDRAGIGMLSREEFVVGLWLIDETLKGHKIPVKVPDSVWSSVRYLPGIKIPQELRP